MTHRVHPYVFRLGETTTWKSRWFNLRRMPELLREDTFLREWLLERLKGMRVSTVEIERSPNTLTVIIRTARPGILIGRGGEGIEKLRREIERELKRLATRFGRRPQGEPERRELKLSIEEVRSPESDARVVGEEIREEIEKRTRFRRILKQTIEKVAGHRDVKGVKIMLSGRLDGAEMSRTEWLKRGRIPLQTLRANLDYALVEAKTTYGTIGIKVWIYKGDVFETDTNSAKA
jgi:small subunit ribosomal protein S3